MSATTTAKDSTDPHSPELLSFRGEDSEDVTVFLQDVKRVANTEGHQRDEEWLVDYVEQCLSGHAFQWFTQHEEQIGGKWKPLRAALTNRFAGSSPQVADPSAAAPPPGSRSAQSSTPIAISRPLVSRIVPYSARESDMGPSTARDFDHEVVVNDIALAREMAHTHFLCRCREENSRPKILQ